MKKMLLVIGVLVSVNVFASDNTMEDERQEKCNLSIARLNKIREINYRYRIGPNDTSDDKLNKSFR